MGVPPTAPVVTAMVRLLAIAASPASPAHASPPFRAANGNGPISPAPDRRAGLAFFALPNGRSLRDQAAFFGRSGPIHTGVVGATGRLLGPPHGAGRHGSAHGQGSSPPAEPKRR